MDVQANLRTELYVVFKNLNIYWVKTIRNLMKTPFYNQIQIKSKMRIYTNGLFHCCYDKPHVHIFIYIIAKLITISRDTYSHRPPLATTLHRLIEVIRICQLLLTSYYLAESLCIINLFYLAF